MPELDTIRGIAILAVLFYHGLYWNTDLATLPHFQRLIITAFWAGRLGVNLFFVLSGFLITGLLLNSRHRKDYYRHFYIRRALRILPAYLALLAILAAFRYTTNSFILLSLAYLSNLTPLFGVAIGYPVLWSLAVEEHFYIVWPAVTRWLKGSALLYCSLFIITVSPLCRLLSFYLASRHGDVSFQVNDYTWNSADGLSCGAVLAIFLRDYRPDRRRLLRLCLFGILLSIGIWIIGIPYGILSRKTSVGMALQIVPWQVFFVALLGIFLLIGSSERRSIVQVSVLRFFGEISYGLYLIHLLIFEGFDWIAKRYNIPGIGWGKLSDLIFRFGYVCCTAILLAYLSRKQFEDRFLRLKNRLS
jgi:peptidoglycan/LPS O-acetylase OafA/YrhL